MIFATVVFYHVSPPSGSLSLEHFSVEIAEVDRMAKAIRCSKFGTAFGTYPIWNTLYNTIVEQFFRFCSKFGYGTWIWLTVGDVLKTPNL